MSPIRCLLVGVLICLVGVGSVNAQESVELPFHMPTPKDWRTETIPFPLDFAPELDYEGIEELRFSPGMFAENKLDFWSYAFVWWVPEETSFDTERLQSDLDLYFRGLNKAVAKAREFELGKAVVEIQLQPVDASSEERRQWKGIARTFDVFATRRPIKLNVRIDISECPEQGYLVAFFQLSPQPVHHNIWDVLDGIREGFRCQP